MNEWITEQTARTMIKERVDRAREPRRARRR